MDIRQIRPTFSVSPQLSLADIGTLAAREFVGIINVRPDFEEEGQPPSEDLEREARAFGLAYCHVPVVPGKMTGAEVAAFAACRATMLGPTLSFCRTGTRAVTLWAYTAVRHVPAATVIQTAAEAGYDLSPKAAALDAYRRARAAQGRGDLNAASGL